MCYLIDSLQFDIEQVSIKEASLLDEAALRNLPLRVWTQQSGCMITLRSFDFNFKHRTPRGVILVERYAL